MFRDKDEHTFGDPFPFTKRLRSYLTAEQNALLESFPPLVATCGNDPAGIRDRAMLLIRFAAPLRRSELADLTSVTSRDARRVGGDIAALQNGPGRRGSARGRALWVKAGMCTVRAYGAWVEVAGLGEGPVFRPVDRHGNIASAPITDRGVALVVKRRRDGCGYRPKRGVGSLVA